jgi:lysophospholipase L1-like esterase
MITGSIKNGVINSAVLLVTLVVVMFLGEGIVRIFVPQEMSGTWRVTTKNGYFVNKSEGTVRHQFGQKVVTYTFYEPHLRGTPLKEKGIRILVIGDSFTFGWNLKKEDTFLQHLQNYSDQEFGYDKFYFLNAGVGGSGTAGQVAFIEDFADRIKPDIVLIVLNAWDAKRSLKKNLYELTSESDLSLKRNIIKANKIRDIVNALPGYQWICEHSHLFRVIRRSWMIFRHKLDVDEKSTIPERDQGESSSDALRLEQSLFYRLKMLCEKNNADLFVTTTGWNAMPEPRGDLAGNDRFIADADKFFEGLNIPFYDISPYVTDMWALDYDKYFSSDFHPNETGSALIGRTVWNHFLKEQLTEYLNRS